MWTHAYILYSKANILQCFFIDKIVLNQYFFELIHGSLLPVVVLFLFSFVLVSLLFA